MKPIAPDQANKQTIIDELLKNLPPETSVEVSLPSENRVYSLPDPLALVTLRPMTFEDEKSLISSPKGQDPINIILNRCCSNISIGDDYHTNLICPSCKEENPTVIRLSQLNVNPVPDNFQDPTEVALPSIKKKAKVRLPRLSDEKYMKTTEESLSNIWRFVTEIAGHTDKHIIASVLEKLPIKDMRIILKAMKTDFGVDTKVKFDCAGCSTQSVVELPIDSNFFDVN